MSNPRLAVLQDEFTAKRAFLDGLDQLAADEKRDLKEEERSDYDAAVTRMEAIEADIRVINQRQQRFDAVAEVTQRSTPAVTNPRIERPSMGEQIKIRALHSLGKDDGQYETLQRVLQHGTVSEGLSTSTVEGDLIAFVDANRYAVNASRRLPMPDNHAKTFQRPRKSGTTSVDIQTNEGDVLASATANVTSDTITKATYGGTVALSEQEIDWTEPAMLQVTVEDLAEQYAIKTDDVLCTAIETASTASAATTLSLTAAADVAVKAIGAAASVAYGTSKKMPDTLFCAPDRFFYLATLPAGDGRLAFPMANVTNSSGSNSPGVRSWNGFEIMGLRVVVDPNFTAGFLAVAASSLIEVYEQNKGLLQIAAPSTLETVIAYRGYFATNVYSQGFGALEA